MTIQVDVAEPKKIFGYFENRLGVEIEKTSLPVGDIVCPEKSIAIERKEISDYISSMQSGHLQKQLIQMKENFDHPYLIISGTLKQYSMKKMNSGFKGRPWTVDHHVGSLASCAVRYGVTILMVENDLQLCKLVLKIIDKTDDGKEVSIRDTELLKNTLTTDDMALKIITCFEGYGIIKGQKKLNDDPTLKEKIMLVINHLEEN